MSRVLLPLLLCTLIAPAIAAGQPDSLLTPGAKVRFSFIKANPISFLDWSPMVDAVVNEVRDDTIVLVINPSVEPVEIPMTALSRLQVSTGTLSPAESALIGAGKGALNAVGVAPLVHMVSRKRGGFNELVETATLLAVLGALSGGIFGAVLPAERWHRVALGHSIEFAPHVRDWFGVHMTVSF